MTRPKGFPWIEGVTLALCAPVIWQIGRLFWTGHLNPSQGADRSLAPTAGLLAAILSVYVAHRLGEIRRWLALALPLVWIAIYFGIGAVLFLLHRVF